MTSAKPRSDHDCALSSWQSPEAQQAVDDVFRKSWRLRRLLDFTRPYKGDLDRAFTREETRKQREKMAMWMQIWADDPQFLNGWADFSEITVAEVLRTIQEMQTWFCPPMGRPRKRPKRKLTRGPAPKYPDFFARVLSWKCTLSVIRTNRQSWISPIGAISSRAASDKITTKAAIEKALSDLLGRPPSKAELRSGQVRFSQLSRHQRD